MPVTKINGIEIYYEVSGAGEPLVLIHGLGASTRDWEEQVAYFSKAYRVVAFDIRGHGRSQKPPGPYSIPLFTSDTVELMKRLGATPAHVVGHSMGGMIAFEMAAIRPELVKSLIIINSGPEFLLGKDKKSGAGLFDRTALLRAVGMRGMGTLMGRMLFPKSEQAHLRKRIAKAWAENDREAYLSSWQALQGWSVMGKIGQITCPTLFVAADRDYTPPAFKAAYLPLMQHAELVVIKDSRHFTPLDQPEQLNRVIDSFLSQHS